MSIHLEEGVDPYKEFYVYKCEYKVDNKVLNKPRYFFEMFVKQILVVVKE